MNKNIILKLSLMISMTLSLFSIDVNEDELKSYGDKKIEFYNYVGPHQFINSIEQITGLGSQLGARVKIDVTGNFSIGNKYSVIHSVQPEVNEGYDGDIFFIGRDGAVDHIRNLRYIIASYLESAYGYSFEDSLLLAEFVTYYNAAHYQNLTYFEGQYKNGVLEHLSADRAGMSTHYSEWAGKSAIVIPLSESRSSETGKTIDTSEITTEEVIEVMREEENDAVETRKDMVELRDEEISKEEEAIAEEKALLNEEKKEIEEAIELIKEDENGVEISSDSLSENDKAKLDKLEEKKEVIIKEEQQLDKEQETLEVKKDEVVKMREDIADDANKQIDEEEKSSVFTSQESGVGQEVIMLKIENTGNGVPYGRLIKIDIVNYKITAESELNSIRGRSLTILGNKLFAVAGMEGGSAAVKLVEIDNQTLNIKNEGTISVFPDTLLWLYKNNFFAIIKEGNDLKLALFDATLTVKATSVVSVEPYMSPLIRGTSIFVQTVKGDFVELSAESLEELNKIE